MNRIDETFRRLKLEGKAAFIPYITCGDPDIKTTHRIVGALVRSGADIIELGIPFSDPLADGPIIQKASMRSLKKGTTLKKILELTKTLRRKYNTPFVYMTYYNVVFNYGLKRFIEDAKSCGADGIIVPDLPLEESRELRRLAEKQDFCLILLAAPTTPPERFREISNFSRGFVYYVSLTGVTGARGSVTSNLKKDLLVLERIKTKPVCVGFGISKMSQAREVARIADGVIVGSAIIKLVEETLGDKREVVSKVESFARSIAKAVHGT